MKIAEKTMNERRIENCVRAAKLAPKGSWAYNFWMKTAGTILRKLTRSTNEKLS